MSDPAPTPPFEHPGQVPGSRKRTSRLAIVALAIAIPGLCLMTSGILAAIAIPTFIGYIKRSKAAEARSHITAIYAGLGSYYSTHGALPEGAPRTPVQIGSERVGWPLDAHPSWNEIGFAPPASGIYHAYEYQPLGGGAFAVRAFGDLDGDGVESLHELTGGVDPTGALFRDPNLRVVNELE